MIRPVLCSWSRTVHIFYRAFVLAVLITGSVSCERVHTQNMDAGGRLVTLRIRGFTDVTIQDASTRALPSSTARLDLVLFNSEGTKVVKVNQQSADDAFCSPQIRVSEGTYTLVIIAHSGTGVATITSPTEVTFPNNKVTDTFYTCQSLTVDESTTSLDITLRRAVAMVRVILTDADPPAEFSQLQLYYTGGSSTFNPTTGFGSKNSRQTELRSCAEVQHDTEGNPLFEVYTFPHAQDGILKLTLTPQDAQGNQIATECIIPEVPVRLNYITEARGNLFAGGSSSFSTTLSIFLNDQWEGKTSIKF